MDMIIFLSAVFAAMIAEAAISRRHERALRAMGAVEAPRDVYEIMLWIYPLCFVLIGAEGVITNRPTSLF
ncbi:MAG: hypothetical protein HY654_12615, partial [Acidobacteria bacterium]|nr:hypothetical protein [Acidobacteriota bacterium]